MRPGGILETILALVLGAVITLYLLIAAVTTYKWAIKTIDDIKEGMQYETTFFTGS